MFHYIEGASNSFDQIAKLHFENLKGVRSLKNGKLSFYAFSITSKIDANTKLRGISCNFFKDLQRDRYKWTEEIIRSKPAALESIISKINQNIELKRYPKIFEIRKKRPILTNFGIKIKNTFDYDTFGRKSSTWNAYMLADFVGINVCAYCNRGYTFTVSRKGKGIVRPEFDHFYSQEKHPYLALSFYNLIPSCHICNSNLKHASEFTFDTHLHPYEISFDSLVRFSVRLKKKKILLSNADEKKSFGLSFFYGDLNSFDLVFRARKKGAMLEGLKKAMRNIQVFKIRELYERHKDLVVEMIINTVVYNDSYIDSLLYNHSNLFRDRPDVIRHITKNFSNSSDFPKRTFSKLTKDIHSEFGLIY